MSLAIRPLTVEHLDEMADIGAEFASEANLSYHPEVMKASIRELFKSVNTAGWGMFDGDVLVGGLLATKTTEWFSTQTIAHEFFWYVCKEYRGRRESLALFHAYMEWAKDADKIRMAHFPGLSLGVERLYEKYGFTLFEQTYERKSWQQ